MYTEFDTLSHKEKSCYNQMMLRLERYEVNFKLEGFDGETVKRAFSALVRDNPQFFWLSGAANFCTTTMGRVIKDVTVTAELQRGVQLYAVPSMAQQFDRTVNSIVQQVRQIRTVYGQVLAVHNYIIDTTDYVLNAPMCYDAYGCLVNHRAVCAGYAKAFMLIMRRLGYVCGYARGWGRETGENHAWNFIKLENDFYFIDVTWDDPTVIGGSRTRDNKSMDFFCLTTEELMKTHRLSSETPVPVCKGTKYNYYRYNRLYLQRYSFSELLPIATAQLKQGKKFTVKFATDYEADRAFTDLITNQMVYKIPGIGNRILYFRKEKHRTLTVENG
ncbi:MAG: hypothetical protein IKM59_02760 [Oscillospiraceae bacterium]|nr:hypothetical protein [Oscillospiraceae bacterium]